MCPHYDGKIERRTAYHKLIESKKIQSGIATDDGVAIHYKEQGISKIVSSKPNAKACSVSFEKKVIETELQTEFLGSY
ncbi:Type 1 glutamine amidotransferase-like domain-containing protein [Paenibacillus sp. AGC30]